MENTASIGKAEDIGPGIVRLVEEYLRLLMIPDPERASAYIAPDLLIRFTGGRPMRAPQECAASCISRSRLNKRVCSRG